METTAQQKTVLIIEDDKALNRAVTFKVEQLGHKVISVMRAEDALTALKDHYAEIDVIWLDILLPGMSGIEFLTEVRKVPEYKDLKVVICSVSGRDESRALARELGVLDYFVKSDYEISDLINKILSYTQ